MAVSPIGSVIYTNQNTPVAAQQQQQVQNRLDFQAAFTSSLAQDQRATVQETRPAEADAGINPDREHQKKEDDAREKARKRREAAAQKDTLSPRHLLDIRV